MKRVFGSSLGDTTNVAGVTAVSESMRQAEVIFEVTEAVEGGYDARALGYDIFTQGDDWDDLKNMAREAVVCHLGDVAAPRVVRLHLVMEEVITM